MSNLRMGVICALIVIWSILVAVFLYYHKMTIDCRTNPAIRCWKDWYCLADSSTKKSNNSNIIPYVTKDGPIGWTFPTAYTGPDPTKEELLSGNFLIPYDTSNIYKNDRLIQPSSCAPLTNSTNTSYKAAVINGQNCCVVSGDGKSCISTNNPATCDAAQGFGICR